MSSRRHCFFSQKGSPYSCYLLILIQPSHFRHANIVLGCLTTSLSCFFRSALAYCRTFDSSNRPSVCNNFSFSMIFVSFSISVLHLLHKKYISFSKHFPPFQSPFFFSSNLFSFFQIFSSFFFSSKKIFFSSLNICLCFSTPPQQNIFLLQIFSAFSFSSPPQKNIFLLIRHRFSSPPKNTFSFFKYCPLFFSGFLLRKKYFPPSFPFFIWSNALQWPDVFLLHDISRLFLLHISSPLQKKIYFLKNFPRFPSSSFLRDIEYEPHISPVILSHINNHPADLSSPIWINY